MRVHDNDLVETVATIVATLVVISVMVAIAITNMHRLEERCAEAGGQLVGSRTDSSICIDPDGRVMPDAKWRNR